jgi:hypothetical protein
MQTSTTVLAVLVQLAVVVLPMFGVSVGSVELTNAVQTLTVILTGLWIWFKRYQAGDIRLFGGYKRPVHD